MKKCKSLISGAHNMRDLGGFENRFGKKVKSDMIFRSDDLTAITMEDLDYLSRIPLRTVIDFRSIPEIDHAIDHLPQTVSKYIKLSIDLGNVSEIDLTKIENPDILMMQMYAEIVRKAQEQFKSFFKFLIEKTNTPILYHCTAGKDRTGIATALFLSALMVDKSDIIEDYMQSADCLKKKFGDIVKRYPELESLFTVKEEYLLEAFKVIDNEYDGIENYLVNHLDVNVLALREIYTF